MRRFALRLFALGVLLVNVALTRAQVREDPGFKALPRPINYATPLAPKGAPKAVIVYGKEAPWTRTAAQAVQKGIQDWSGAALELADDRTVTSDESWLLTDACRNTPMIVLGNAQDNRLMHALGTRYLLQSNRTWPGGDRYVIRSVFEPFVADVNYVVLEASNQAGMDAAAEKFAELLKTFPTDNQATATVPACLRVVSGVKNKWKPYQFPAASWNPIPTEMLKSPQSRVAELAMLYKGTPPRAGWGILHDSRLPDVWGYATGGTEQYPRNQDWRTPDLDAGTIKTMAALCLLGCRNVGGRAYAPMDHYGAAPFLVQLRAIFQTGVLTDKELNEFESAMVLSTCDPKDFLFDHIGNGDGIVGGVLSGRHTSACLITAVQELDYVLNHCRLDDRTRKEVQRRRDGARKTVASYIRSFRGNNDDSCLGEDTVLQFYSELQEGFMENVRNGMLRRSADLYIMTSDNIPFHSSGDPYAIPCYAGLSGFSSGEGGMVGAWEGGSLVAAAAFYYDDPQYRWFVRNRNLYLGSEAAYHYNMHSAYDTVGAVAPPDRYLGVRALPMDERVYNVLARPQTPGRMNVELRLAPDHLETAADRVCFRDGFNPNDAYLFLATSQDMFLRYPTQNNSIARYTDLGDIWLFANTYDGSTWSRSVVNCSSGGNFVPRAACQVEAMANLGDVSMISSMEPNSGGADWTRTIVHWKGHYFVVLDCMQARQEDDYTFVCRWRSLQSASLANGAWTATAPGGNAMRVQSAEDVVATSEAWTCDGSASPFLLQQYKQAHLAKGREQTYLNLLYVSGQQRPDHFETRQAGTRAMMVKGQTKDGAHLALIGTGGNIPLGEFRTDAAIYSVTGDRLHLAGVKLLTARVAGEQREVLRAPQTVNALIDCRTGKAQIEVAGDKALQVKVGQGWSTLKPGSQTVTLAAEDALPKASTLLEGQWPKCRAPSGKAPQAPGGVQAFDLRSSASPLQKPLLRLAGATVTPKPGGVNNDGQIWKQADKFELLLTFTRPTEVGCLKLVGPATRVAERFRTGGQPYNARNFRFSLELSDDNFQKDVRKIDSPQVVFEETPRMGAGHFVMTRHPTCRLEIGAKAQQFKLQLAAKQPMPLVLADLEVYGIAKADQLQAKAFVADINGDGSNELVVGTSQRELAAYSADGHRLWSKVYDADIHDISTADLNDDGKAEAIVYLTTEKLHRVNGDGTEWPIADVNTVCTQGVNITSIASWAPQGPTKKEVVLWSGEPSAFRVLPDGTVKPLKAYSPQASLRLMNFYPNEPEALATLSSAEFSIWSPKPDAEGNYTRLGSNRVTGSNSGNEASPPGVLRQFCDILSLDVHGEKWLVGAVASGLNCFPLTAFAKGAKEAGWKYDTGGPCGTAVAALDTNHDNVPEILLARQDGFVNVFKLKDGAPAGHISVGEPIIGIAVLGGKLPRIAVCTKFGVYLYGTDLKLIGGTKLPSLAVAFAGPAGAIKDRVFVVDSAGGVTVLAPKPN